MNMKITEQRLTQGLGIATGCTRFSTLKIIEALRSQQISTAKH